jgi:hypothetical protein
MRIEPRIPGDTYVALPQVGFQRLLRCDTATGEKGLAVFWVLPIVGTKTWNSLLNQPVESLNKVLYVNKKKQFYEDCPFQKVVFAAFIH